MELEIKTHRITDSELREIGQKNLEKLRAYKANGYSKERCYEKFSKVFVDKHYHEN